MIMAVVHAHRRGFDSPSCRILLSVGGSPSTPLAVVNGVPFKVTQFDTISAVNGRISCDVGANSKIIPKLKGRYLVSLSGTFQGNNNNMAYTFTLRVNNVDTSAFAKGFIKFAMDRDNFSIDIPMDFEKEDILELYGESSLSGNFIVEAVSLSATKSEV